MKWHFRNVHPVAVSQQGPRTVQPPPQMTPKGHDCLFHSNAFPWLVGGAAAACVGLGWEAVVAAAILLNIITGRRVRFMVCLGRCF